MRKGRFTQIPEGPADMAELWRQAQPLTQETLPLWGSETAADRYRYLGSVAASGLSAEQESLLLAEIEELPTAGLAIDSDGLDPATHRIYVPGPLESNIWSIGIAVGESPLTFPNATQRAVLTNSDVTDVVATFVADPFMLRRDPCWFMFFEIMNWQLGRGQIGLAESADGTDWTYQGVVLTEPFHLSYPYVFEWDGRYYMIPETHQTKSVRLYEAISFPTRWSYVRTLLEGQYFADASIVRHKEIWWLFVDTSPKKNNDTLSLFYSDDLHRPWIEHSQSPIVHGDARIARPGGRVTVQGDTIFRYAQNCSQHYGTEVLAFEITELSRNGYEEREVAGPVLSGSGNGWNAHGMHNIDPHRLEDGRWLACVDGWTREHGWADVVDVRADIESGLMRLDIERTVPAGSIFLLVDKGQDILVSDDRRAIPFPERNGGWGGYPADDTAAVAELTRLRQAGAEFIVFPSGMRYWLDTYVGLRSHLFATAKQIFNSDRCSIFDLRKPLI